MKSWIIHVIDPQMFVFQSNYLYQYTDKGNGTNQQANGNSSTGNSSSSQSSKGSKSNPAILPIVLPVSIGLGIISAISICLWRNRSSLKRRQSCKHHYSTINTITICYSFLSLASTLCPESFRELCCSLEKSYDLINIYLCSFQKKIFIYVTYIPIKIDVLSNLYFIRSNKKQFNSLFVNFIQLVQRKLKILNQCCWTHQ